jgi:hypothetical protein
VDGGRAALLRSVGQGEAFVRVYDRPERLWLSFALEGDGPILWPRGFNLALELKDGRVLWADELAGVTPEARLIPLGGSSLQLPADALERRRFRDRGVCGVMFASFPGTVMPGQIAGVRAGLDPQRNGPHPAPAGAP